MAAIRGTGLLTQLGALATNGESLFPGNSRILPAGELMVGLGQYSYLQIWDPVMSVWKVIPRSTDGVAYVDSDGTNFRLINMSGCAAGAVITNAGTNYAATTTVTASAGGSLWRPVIGGRLNTSVTVVTGGSGYTYAPRVQIPAPGPGGVPATAHTTLSAGAVNTVVIDNQGGGYVGSQTLTFITDPRDPSTTIVPAAPIVQALTGAGTLSAILCTDPGTPVTAVPTLTITDPTGAGASAAATALMNFSVTGYTVSTAGTFHAGTVLTSSSGTSPTSVSAANVNPVVEKGIIKPRNCWIIPALATGIVASATTAPLSVDDWGIGFHLIPILVPLDGTGLSGGVWAGAATVGGQLDFVWAQPLRG